MRGNLLGGVCGQSVGPELLFMFYKTVMPHCISEIGSGVSPFTLESLTSGREATSQGYADSPSGAVVMFYKGVMPHCISEIALGFPLLH